ncbi:MAG: acyl-CoA dehydrogenase family protein [bacterium]
MTAQFELGSKHIECKKQAQLAISEIKTNNPKEIVKELYNKSYGFIPQNSKTYNDYLGLVVTLEEFAKIRPEAASIIIDQILVQELLLKYGINSSKNSFNSQNIYAVLCAEPGNALISSLLTKATKTSPGWKLEGKKLITKEQINADKYIIFAKDEQAKTRVFLVSKDDIKISGISKNIAGSNIVLNQIELNIKLSEECNIAIIEDNYENNTSIARTLIASVALGVAHSALVAGINAAKETKGPENQTISNTQSMQFTLADMFAELEASRMLTYYSANLIDNNKSNIKYATIAKVQATDSATGISVQALQLLGNLGYLANNDFAGFMQSAISGQVKGGTNRVQRNFIYQYMLAKK